MNANQYVREYLRDRQRPLTQADLRIAMIMSLVALILANLIV